MKSYVIGVCPVHLSCEGELNPGPKRVTIKAVGPDGSSFSLFRNTAFNPDGRPAAHMAYVGFPRDLERFNHLSIKVGTFQDSKTNATAKMSLKTLAKKLTNVPQQIKINLQSCLPSEEGQANYKLNLSMKLAFLQFGVTQLQFNFQFKDSNWAEDKDYALYLTHPEIHNGEEVKGYELTFDHKQKIEYPLVSLKVRNNKNVIVAQSELDFFSVIDDAGANYETVETQGGGEVRKYKEGHTVRTYKEYTKGKAEDVYDVRNYPITLYRTMPDNEDPVIIMGTWRFSKQPEPEPEQIKKKTNDVLNKSEVSRPTAANKQGPLDSTGGSKGITSQSAGLPKTANKPTPRSVKTPTVAAPAKEGAGFSSLADARKAIMEKKKTQALVKTKSSSSEASLVANSQDVIGDKEQSDIDRILSNLNSRGGSVIITDNDKVQGGCCFRLCCGSKKNGDEPTLTRSNSSKVAKIRSTSSSSSSSLSSLSVPTHDDI